MAFSESPSQPSAVDSQFRRWQLWLGLLAPFYFLSPLSLLALRFLGTLPQPARWLIALYAASQLLPALLSPEPLLSSGLALLRITLITGLICVGAFLSRSPSQTPFRWLGLGLTLVYLTALGFGLWQGRDFLVARLSHPYMTSVTLGLLGAVGLWWSALSSGRWTGRLPVGLLAIVTLLLSGSRGPLLAAVLGMLAGIMVRQLRGRTLVLLTLGLLTLAGLAAFGMRGQLAPLTRLMQLDVAGRQIIWHNVLTVIQSEPLSGVGAYRLGTRLASPQSCQTFADAQQAYGCPAWFDALGQPWLIAHNAVLQEWAEAGPLGTFGLFLLLGGVLVATWRGRDPFAVAVTTGLLVTNINDNTLLVPGPFVGELFWVLAGTQLARVSFKISVPAVGSAGALALLSLSAPLILVSRPAQLSSAPHLTAFYAPTRPSAQQLAGDYHMFASVALPAGTYLAALNTCTGSCRTIESRPVTSDGQQNITLDWKGLHLLHVSKQQLELVFFAKDGLKLRSIAAHRWVVKSN